MVLAQLSKVFINSTSEEVQTVKIRLWGKAPGNSFH
jgi:hypothetical protein